MTDKKLQYLSFALTVAIAVVVIAQIYLDNLAG